jgi:hypothetical protein
MTTARRQWRQHDRLAERGRLLASAREDLIAAGADPDELPVPLHPVPPPGPRPGPAFTTPPAGPSQAQYLRELSRAWAIVALACFAALAGCVAATGAMLVINDALTWEALVGTGAGLMWSGGALLAAGHASGLARRARALQAPKPRPVLGGCVPLRVVQDESP